MVDKKVVVSASAGLIAALIVGLLFLVFTKAKTPPKEAVAVKVLAAATDIPAGTQLTPQQVTYLNVSGKTPPAGVFTNVSQVSGIKTVRSLRAGEILTTAAFTAAEKEAIPAGFVAVALKVNDVSGVAGMVSQGDRVDVIGAFRSPEKQQDRVSRIILQAIKVLSVSIPEKKGSRGDYTVTLLMKPEEAQKLILTYTTGEYTLALRGTTDEAPYKEQPITVAEMSGAGKKPEAAKAAKAKKPSGRRQIVVEKVIEIVEVK